MFKGFLGKMECETQCLFHNLNNFLATKIALAKRVSDDDLRSPDTFDTCLGEQASANVTPCFSKRLHQLLKIHPKISFTESLLKSLVSLHCFQVDFIFIVGRFGKLIANDSQFNTI